VTTTYSDLVSAYLSDPGPETLDALRRAVRTAPNFTRDLELDRTVKPLMDRGAYDQAITELMGMMPGAIFSPSAHKALSVALDRTGQEQASAREASVAEAAMRSILSTGDGTAARPWSVLRISDEYDVLRRLRTAPRGQRLVQRGGRAIDVLTCDDGSELHFDVTSLVSDH
jgi:hypothetical protein